MSKIATVPPHAASSGLALSTKEDSRWGYVREDDDDVSGLTRQRSRISGTEAPGKC
jgi:hypothetical protein